MEAPPQVTGPELAGRPHDGLEGSVWEGSLVSSLKNAPAAGGFHAGRED